MLKTAQVGKSLRIRSLRAYEHLKILFQCNMYALVVHPIATTFPYL